MKIIFVIIDGLADKPTPDFDFKTPLEIAKKPNLDFLAKESRLGLLLPIPSEEHPTSEKAHFAIFGYNLKKEFPGRGPLEALGIGIQLKEGQVAFRANFATLDKKGNLIDVRAGRIKNTKSLCQVIDNIVIDGVLIRIYPSLEHRAVLILEGKGISEKVFGNDPHKLPPFKIGVPPLQIKPKGDIKEAKFTAQILEKYLQKIKPILENHPENKKREKEGNFPANFLLVREGGKYFKVASFNERYSYKACCIAGAPLYKGIARFLGMDVLEVKGATGTKTTNLKNKFLKTRKALLKYDFVFLHIKACDIFSEDGDFEGKKKFIEKIDHHLPILMGIKNIKIVVTADHATPVSLKAHSSDPVPFLIFDAKNKDEIDGFSERKAKGGHFGLIKNGELLRFLLPSSLK